MSSCKISVSILGTNFFDLRKNIKIIEKSKCDFVHFDVMDGVFVPNMTFGHKFISDIRGETDIKFDTHLMTSNPEKYVDEFVKAGSDYITFHYEAVEKPLVLIKKIKSLNVKVGISIKPKTDVSVINPLLKYLDLILIMTVEPGFAGQKFIESCVEKIEQLDLLKKKKRYDFLISADGGIGLKNIEKLKNSGLNIGVTGTSFFDAKNKKIFVEEFKK